MPASPPLYLASASPRRLELLRQLGLQPQLLLADTDEDSEALECALRGESASRYVVRVTGLKLDAARQRLRRRGLPAGVILCADTTVALGSRLLGKPLDAADAVATLQTLSGRSHRVLTAVAVAHGRRSWQALSVSRVGMAALSRSQIAAYVASGEPLGKAGSYAIQGRAGGFIQHISGSYTGIMGLPLFETRQLLENAGIRP